MDVEDGDHTNHGKFCACEGQEEDLCNWVYFKDDPNSGRRLAASLVTAVMLLLLIIH